MRYNPSTIEQILLLKSSRRNDNSIRYKLTPDPRQLPGWARTHDLNVIIFIAAQKCKTYIDSWLVVWNESFVSRI